MTITLICFCTTTTHRQQLCQVNQLKNESEVANTKRHEQGLLLNCRSNHASHRQNKDVVHMDSLSSSSSFTIHKTDSNDIRGIEEDDHYDRTARSLHDDSNLSNDTHGEIGLFLASGSSIAIAGPGMDLLVLMGSDIGNRTRGVFRHHLILDSYRLMPRLVPAVIVFIIVGFLYINGVSGAPIPRAPKPGSDMFNMSSFNERFVNLFNVFLNAGFSFQGAKMVGIAAGATKDLRKNVP
ncbi:hypothetical protein BGZ50_007659 [Haplosporangium sp. Z 11]|nr:hypothetical protein BGZ50_007659 [Haplosporangium sp. Z 11]